MIEFNLFEAKVKLFQNPHGFPGDVWIDDNGAGYPILRIQIEPMSAVMACSKFRFDIGFTRKLNVILPDFRVKELQTWLTQIQAQFEVVYAPESQAPAPAASIAPAAVCAECFGTGYKKGFGAPCSRGCKVI